MPVFNAKNFNGEVFGQYVETVPRVKQNAFLSAGILRSRDDLKQKFADQTGGNFITVPLTGRINGDVLNYDGTTDMVSTGIDTYTQGMVCVGRMKSWDELDFSQEVTGHDFMQDVAAQVANYWDDVDQATILATLDGIFKVSDDGFNERHTLDITGEFDTNAKVGVATLNDAIQKAAGANKNLFTMAIIHSQVATNLENLQVLEYFKYNDANGMQRQNSLATWNGRTVLIDDDVPCEYTQTALGEYNLKIDTAAVAGDKIRIFGTEYTFVAESATPTKYQIKVGASGTASQQATNIADKLNTQTSGTATKYTITANSVNVVFKQKAGAYGYHKPSVVAQGTLAVTVTQVTEAKEYSSYISYLLGMGAFDYINCGARIPYEMKRDPWSKGGRDILFTRQRKVFAPRGFSYKQPSSTSPTDADLKDADNWFVVKNDTGSKYFDSRAIPFARIISKG